MTIAGPQPITKQLRWILLAAVVAVVLALFQLYVFSEETQDWFAWTVAQPMSAALLGSGYLASLPMLGLTGQRSRWADARAPIYGTTAFTVVTLVTTLVHLDAFHLDEGVATAKIAGWGWLAVYIVLPLVLGWVIMLQRRTIGLEPSVTDPALSVTGQKVVHALGLLLVVLAIVLFVGGDEITWWPWPLTDLTARAISAWAMGLGATAIAAARERELTRIRPVLVAGVVYAVAVLVALLRFNDDIDWSPSGTVFAVVIAGIGAVCLTPLLRHGMASTSAT